MTILGIETSCDETGVAVIQSNSKTNKINLISNIVASSISLHSETGGIIPEIAAREQIEYIIPVLESALKEASREEMVNGKPASPAGRWSIVNSIDAIAVTVGPGLIGSLLIGVETAKTLSYLWKKPIIPVNHLIGHIYANWINEERKTNNEKRIIFPALALIVSGGHTDLVLLRDHATPAMPAHSAGGRGKIKWLGGTRDDAAGEAFDKIGRLLNLPYPGGPSIEKEALKGNPMKFIFPKPMIGSGDFDFSFSGLKAAVFRKVQTMKQLNNQAISDISYAVQDAIVDVLVNKTLKAADKYKVKSLLLGGGVAANSKLRERFQSSIVNRKSSFKLFVPTKSLCTDNAAMIASAAFYNYKPVDWRDITVNPELYFY